MRTRENVKMLISRVVINLKITTMKWEFPKDLSIHFNRDNGEYRVYRKTLLITKCHTLYTARTYVDAIIRALTIE